MQNLCHQPTITYCTSLPITEQQVFRVGLPIVLYVLLQMGQQFIGDWKASDSILSLG